MTEAKKQYRVVVGINYPTPDGEKRAEPGEVVDDIPTKSLGWLLKDGIVVEEKKGKA